MRDEMDGVLDDLYQQIATLKAQRDELLKAVKQIDSIMIHTSDCPARDGGECLCRKAILSRAIAVVEKEGK